MTSIAFRDAVAGAVVQRCWMASLEFEYQTIRVFQGEGVIDVPALGRCIGLGRFATLSSIRQPIGGAAPSASIGLSGIDTEIAALARKADSEVKGRICRIHLGVWTNEGEFAGLVTPLTAIMDRMTFAARTEEGMQLWDITVSLESIVGSRRVKPSYATYTDADQQARFAGDRGCEFGGLIAQKSYQWPVLT